MPPLFKLILARLRMLGHVVTGLRRGGVLKFLVIMSFMVLLIGALFGAITRGFIFLRGQGGAWNILLPYLFSTYFLTMLLMLTFSNAVISFGALFRSPETRLLMSMPLPARSVYNYKAGESLLFSSWAFLMLSGPLMISYGLYGGHGRLGASFYLATAAMMVPFVFIPSALGSLLGMLLTRFFPRARGKVLGLIFAVVAFAAIVAGVFLAVKSGLTEKHTVIDQALLERIMDTFAFSQSPWAPSFWISEGLLRAAEQKWATVAFCWGLLASTALFLWTFNDFAAEKLYAASYSRGAGAPTRRFYRMGGVIDWLSQGFSRFAPFTSRLVAKDVRTFLRDPVQYLQVFIFFGVLFLYVANFRNLGYHGLVLEHIRSLRWTNFVAFTNLAAAGLTLATLTTRFVFPLISIEGKRFWVLSLLPVKRSRLLLGKYVFSLGGSLMLIVPLVLLSSYMLRTPGDMAWMHVFTALCMCLGLPAIAVGMGAIFPNYREESPAKIVSGFGGTLCLVLSIGFVGLLVLGVGLLCRQYVFAQVGIRSLSRPLQWATFLALSLSAMATALPLWLGCRAINKAEL